MLMPKRAAISGCCGWFCGRKESNVRFDLKDKAIWNEREKTHLDDHGRTRPQLSRRVFLEESLKVLLAKSDTVPLDLGHRDNLPIPLGFAGLAIATNTNVFRRHVGLRKRIVGRVGSLDDASLVRRPLAILNLDIFADKSSVFNAGVDKVDDVVQTLRS